MIIDHDHPLYRQKWQNAGPNAYNGAFYYSKEICKNIIPRVKTDYNWITVNIEGAACDHAIVFIHNNLYPERYAWLQNYKDLLLVCGVEETMAKVAHLGRPIYLPLSVDVEDVSRYRTEKTKDTAFVGRPAKRRYAGVELPIGIDYLENLPRTKLLAAMAEYQTIYGVGRCAIEAKVLGCQVKAYDPRFPNPDRWKVLDNKDAAKMLQKELNKLNNNK